MTDNSSKEQRWLPKRIILLRHGESTGNDEDSCGITPDHNIRLTPQGVEQAQEAGTLIKRLLDDNSSPNCNWKVYIYVSPYESTRSTLREIGQAFPRSKVAGVREECRIREQDFGNFHSTQKMKQHEEMRNKFSKFFYRFPDGESGADVYDRVSNFLESLWRDIDMKRFRHDPEDELNVVIVSHGLAIRIFMMRWFRWTVDELERLKNPKHCEFRVMQLGEGGEYSLAIHHDDDEELIGWGLSPEMIADQKLRALSLDRRSEMEDECRWYDDFFSLEQQDEG